MVAQLAGISSLLFPLSVKVANVATVLCDSQLSQAKWEVQEHEFQSNLKVLSLTHFDMILGYDWLEMHNPFKVHWKAKWMVIPYGQETVILQGILSRLQPWDVVQIYQLSEEGNELTSASADTVSDTILLEIKELITVYADVFPSHVSFPPPRERSHVIPLIPGASPVNVRPYRYVPLLRDEIEMQVKHILEAGLIQPSNSHFSSPVLLVNRKDRTYHFHVDYRHLNAITLKGKYHVPIIDEFLDELRQARWFSTLDLCSGFHQIPMHHEDCFKTAF
jgi:hypothetical protein